MSRPLVVCSEDGLLRDPVAEMVPSRCRTPGISPAAPFPCPPIPPWGSREITLLGLQAQHCRPHHSFGIAVEWFRPGPTVQTVPKPPTLQTVLNFRAPRPQNCRQCHTFGPPGPPAAHDEIAGMVSSRFPPGRGKISTPSWTISLPKLKMILLGPSPGARAPAPGPGARAGARGSCPGPGPGTRARGPGPGPGALGSGPGPGTQGPQPEPSPDGQTADADAPPFQHAEMLLGGRCAMTRGRLGGRPGFSNPRPPKKTF